MANQLERTEQEMAAIGQPSLKNSTLRRYLLDTVSGVAFACVGALSIAAFADLTGNAAYAQEEATETAETSSNEEIETEEIVISGTRLKNKSFAGVAPVQVLSPEKANLVGDYTATSIVRSSSLATGSFQINQQLGATAPGGTVSNGGAGANGLSLRGLGTQRSLIVLDGRRLSPAGVQGRIGSVDLNVLPGSAIANVEIIKDGSSSVFGADAIAGVVNGVTRKNYDGGAINVNGNIPFAGGGEQFYISGNYGKTFDKGWVAFAAEYTEEKRLRNSDRDFLSCSEEYIFHPGTDERADVLAPDGSFKCRNHNPNGAFFSAD
ncbi:MAG: TonB-dependent receptor plug domain-containing protein, partial [Kordiimonas sp.]